MRKSDVK